MQEPTNTRDAAHRAPLCSAPIRSQPGYGDTSALTSIRSLEDLARRDPAPCAGVLDCSGRSRISVQAADGLPIQWNEPIQAFSTDGADQPLADAVRHRTAWRNLQHSQPEVANGSVEFDREDAVTVMDQITVCGLVP